MRVRTIVAVGAGAVALTVGGFAAGAAGSGGDEAERELRVKGPVTEYSSVTSNPVQGVVARVRAEADGNHTEVSLRLKGFDRAMAGRTFGAHVHTGPCVSGSGVEAGPHSRVTGTAPLDQREIWLDFVVTAGGHAQSTAERPFVLVPGGAKSIVIHANPTAPDGTAGARLGCIGLEL